jgi:FkbM family methyltransferase
MLQVSPDRKATVDARASFLELAQGFTPLVAVDSERAQYLVSTSDYGVSKSLFIRTARGEMRLLARALKILGALGLDDGVRDGTFVDVGANIGTTTITAMCSHGFARAIACEPEPHNQGLLELNLVGNGLERDVEICRAAIGERDGTVQLRVNKFRSGGHEVHSSGRPVAGDSKAYELIDVDQVTLDSLAETGNLDPADVTFLWMDAQGHEGHVLRGASSLTDRGVPVVLELFPKMMAQHGGLGLFKGVVFDRYTHFVRAHRARGKVEARFDLTPIGELEQEIDRLLGGAKVTDVLLVRDPRSRPRLGGGPGRPVEARERVAREYGDRAVRDPSTASPAERQSFLNRASDLTSLVAAEIESATFLVRTSADALERPLFVERSHPRLELLGRTLATLDELGLGRGARDRTFLEVEAGVGIATVAAVRWCGFSRALACEADQSAYPTLKLNVAANDLRDRVRTLPVSVGGGGDVSLDDLVRRGLIASREVGLLWMDGAQSAGILHGARALLEAAPPLVCRSNAVASLEDTHTHFVRLDEAGTTLVPIDSLERHGAGRSVHILAVRI